MSNVQLHKILLLLITQKCFDFPQSKQVFQFIDYIFIKIEYIQVHFNKL